ncbi:sigma-70 family RNA polymerase sigma factor [Sphingobacterium sp. UT-1RO-CII-1]|uniref:RNA polymerase sigma factor n=1 Tax=Sphingobacterium sp. UT-1RO-CII-1 TaxID=2995225 RepID=UPI00227D06E2|nr:sigma-70 family RNA polymerase sigma factor [Sphingobacterium sp. UT-1RO-CII-1]MCY4779355.1 sigma-70 family RNA polymerase sigma factor [Sphingobacterium sp. UT-1RO-CII-1]
MKQQVKDISVEEFRSFQSGDSKAFRMIFEKYKDTLYRFAYSISKDSFVAEEAVQECFIVLHEKRITIQEPNGIYPFLFVLIKRHLIKVFRRSVVATRYKNEQLPTWTEDRNTLEEHLECKDLLDLINKLVDHLPDKEQQVFRLNKLDGYSCEEISQDLKTSKNTVKNQLATASKKIRLQLSRMYSLII